MADDQEYLKRELNDTFKQKTQKEWLKILTDMCTPVNNVEEVFQDPQVLHRDMLETVSHSAAGTTEQVGTPIKSSDTHYRIRLPPPMFGEHTHKILEDLGFTAQEIEDLSAQGVI